MLARQMRHDFNISSRGCVWLLSQTVHYDKTCLTKYTQDTNDKDAVTEEKRMNMNSWRSHL